MSGGLYWQEEEVKIRHVFCASMREKNVVQIYDVLTLLTGLFKKSESANLKSKWKLTRTYIYHLHHHHYIAQIAGRKYLRWFLAATKQLYKWYFPSVRLSVRPSVCHTFFTMFPSSYHHQIFRSYYHGQKWCPCERSRSEVKGQGHRGQHPT